MKILHFADLHIGVENYGRPDPATGFSTRLLDFLNAFDELVNCAIDEDVDLVLFAGDAYKSREPSQTHQREFAKRIRRLRTAGIPVFLLIGNHDLPNAVSRANALEIFHTLEIEGVYVAPRLEAMRIPTRAGDLQIVAVPWPNQSLLLSRDEYKNKTIDQIDRDTERILTDAIENLGWAQDPCLPTILAAHIAISESRVKTGSEKWMTVGHFPALLPSSLRPDLFDYVALGHHHVHQQLGDRPPIVYPGSLQRVDFGEEKDPKGFIILELDPAPPRGERVVSIDFREVHARRFVTIAVSPRGEDPTDEVVAAIERAGVADAIVRVQLALRPAQDALLREAEIRHALVDAHYIASITRDVEQPARRRLSSDHEPEQLTPLDALKLYLEQKGIVAEQQAVLLEHAQRLIERESRSAP
ncbi:MAG TPA: exonuclease subunit SbcD [Dehalococcoidia bacterium]|nr:exonuclease subunit SbcD [Dehalococcoidia bacterium]